MDDFKLGDFNIVILANVNNPTILNPDFLIMNSIVSGDDCKPNNVITTPTFSTISYDNGISIMVDSNKIQVTDANGVKLAESTICDMTAHYVEALPHVKYTVLPSA